MSLRPFIHRTGPTYSDRNKRKGQEEVVEDAALVADAGEAFFAGPVAIEWRMVLWVIFRDQIVAPFVQGGAWWAVSAVGITAATGAWRKSGSQRQVSRLSRFLTGWIRQLRGRVTT